MEKRPARFPRLSLARSGAVHLTVFGIYELTEERMAMLPDASIASREQVTGLGVFSQSTYTPRGTDRNSYLIGATVHSNDDENEIHVTISYRKATNESSRRRPRIASEATVLEIAEAMGAARKAGGSVLFQFENKDPNQLWFPLPVSLAGKSAEELIEVRGVRGAKLGAQGSKDDYEFILDRPDADRVVLHVEIGMQGLITAESPRLLLKRAETIARDLVTPV